MTAQSLTTMLTKMMNRDLVEGATFWIDHDTLYETYETTFPQGCYNHGSGEGRGLDESNLFEIEDLEVFTQWAERTIVVLEDDVFAETVARQVKEVFFQFMSNESDEMLEDMEGEFAEEAEDAIQRAFNRPRVDERLASYGVSREQYEAQVQQEWENLFDDTPEPEWMDSVRWMNHPSWKTELANC